MTHLYLVRHGETDWNAERRIQGSTDIPLNETGRAQARATGRLLARHGWDLVVASPLSRAFETAQIISAELGMGEPTALPALVERNYGVAEGLRDREVDALYPGDTPVPGRETREEVTARVMPALMELAEAHLGQSILVVAHGGVIRSVLSVVDPGNSHGMITNGSVHSLQYLDGQFRLVAFDDPIESETRGLATDDIDAQNALEARDHGA